MPEWSVKYRTHKRAQIPCRRAKTCQSGAVEITRGWKSDEERGPTGAWFVRAIGERSLETVAKDMADRGHVHGVDYYRGIMSGAKKPGRVLLAALEEYLGSSPSAPKPPADQSDVAAAIDRQTAMLERMLKSIDDRLRTLDEKGTARTVEVLEAVADAEAALAAKLPAASPARSTPPTQPDQSPHPPVENRGSK